MHSLQEKGFAMISRAVAGTPGASPVRGRRAGGVGCFRPLQRSRGGRVGPGRPARVCVFGAVDYGSGSACSACAGRGFLATGGVFWSLAGMFLIAGAVFTDLFVDLLFP